MNNDGTGQTQLTSGSVLDHHPAFSPDGTQIAFQRWGFRGDYFDLMIMDADGTNVQRITYSGIPGMTEGSFEYPKWSEDGTKLAFQYKEATTGGSGFHWICTINIDGTGVDVLDRGMFPRFCCGDTKIIFNTDPFYEDGNCIALMNVDGTSVHILTDGPRDATPHMSSITNRIVFMRGYAANPPIDLYLMNEDGSALESLKSDGMRNWYPEWSPDEKYIVYQSKKSGNYDIWKMEAPPAKISATAEIHPRTLNLRSKGKWITVYIELPEGYDVNDIDVSTVMLNDTVPAELHPTEVGDYDGDGAPDLMIKFDRAEVIGYILTVTSSPNDKSTYVRLTVTGQLDDGTTFEGSDTIRVIFPGTKHEMVPY